MSRVASRFLVVAMATLLATGWLSARPSTAVAASGDLFFTEYIEGSSNNKALEIANDTGVAVNLGTGSYNVQMFFNGNAAAGLTINLTGTVAAGDVFVLAQASANATILAQADQTSTAGWFNGDDAVVLRKGTTILDAIGQTGFDPGTEWGTGVTSTADNTLSRKTTTTVGDTNASDVFDPSVEWDGYAQDDASNLGCWPARPCPNELSINDRSQAEGPTGSGLMDFTVSLTRPAGTGGVTFDIGTQDDTATTADGDYIGDALTGQTIPAGQSTYTYSVVVNGDGTEEADESFFVNVTNVVGATVADGQGVGTLVNDDSNPCDDPYTTIPDIQGAGPVAAITGNVTTQGIVVGDFEGSTAGSGFYLQDPDGDDNTSTSDGIFIFTGNQNLAAAGDLVRVTGTARERFPNAITGAGLTSITGAASQTTPVAAASVVNCGTGTVAITEVTLPFATLDFPERYEGMSVKFAQSLVIAEYFNYDQFGEIVLALPLPGESRPFTGTAVDEPGAAANARTLANALSRITLDDLQAGQNPAVLRHPNGQPFSLTNLFRGGDLVANTTGVMGFDFNLYRILPTAGADYTQVNPRPAAPENTDGRLTVAAMNTLNFFVTGDVDSPNGGPGDNVCGGNHNLECRGWDTSQPTELQRQRDKLLQALVGLDADVLGLNELENGPGDALADEDNGIVVGLNDILGDGTYAYIDTGIIGTDAIRVGLIYKPAVVTPVGTFKLLTSAVDPRFIDTRSRPALAQTFEENLTGERFTVVVNHLKSKGSACAGDPDLGDGQGNCSQTRRAAAEALVDWLATDPTGSGDPDFLIAGDLNSYAKEQTIDEIKQGADDVDGSADDWTNLIEEYIGTYAYSYTFDGQAGYLDHALANANLSGQVTGAAEWHINSDEPDVIDYDTTFKPAGQEALWEPNAYRTSDHDPVLVGLDLNAPPDFAIVAGGSCSSTVNGGSFLVQVSDLQTAAASLSLTLTGNTNTTLVPNTNVAISGGATRTIAITAANKKSGTGVLTFSLSDGVNTVTFDITVKAGTDANETFTGTAGSDLILAGQGIDTLNGLAGADVLCGGNGNDTLNGGDGADTLDGQAGIDGLSGGNGDDALFGGQGNDSLNGGANADLFSGGAGADVNLDFNAGDGDTSDGT